MPISSSNKATAKVVAMTTTVPELRERSPSGAPAAAPLSAQPPDTFKTSLDRPVGTTPAFHRASMLKPFLDDPENSVLFVDLDGTLSPLVEDATQATVPLGTVVAMARAQALGMRVVVITGRDPVSAREMLKKEARREVRENEELTGTVARLAKEDLFDIHGLHGAVYLAAGSEQEQMDPLVAASEPGVRAFVEGIFGTLGLSRGQAAKFSWHRGRLVPHHGEGHESIRVEDKGPIKALHWRGVADEAAAQNEALRIGYAARAAGLWTEEGNKVLEIRPPVPFNKGLAAEKDLQWTGRKRAIYLGDDRTDLDAMFLLRRLKEQGRLEDVVCFAVHQADGPVEELRAFIASFGMLADTNDAASLVAQIATKPDTVSWL